jgi:hypothetical protein
MTEKFQPKGVGEESALSDALYKRFTSQDPYTVLGISRDATIEEAGRAFKKLIVVFHQDKFRGTSDEKRAIEISQGLVRAYERFKMRPEQSLDTSANLDKRTPIGVADIIASLYASPERFEQVRSIARGQGVSAKDIAEIISRKSSQDALQSTFFANMRGTAVFGPTRILEYRDRWKKVDIDLSTLFSTLEAKQIIAEVVSARIKIKQPVAQCLEALSQWKDIVPVDAVELLAMPVCKHALKDRAEAIRKEGKKALKEFCTQWEQQGWKVPFEISVHYLF